MSIKRISPENISGAYFLTLTVRNWYYIFDRHGRWEILADALSHCQKHKGLRLFAYVFMLNHLHLIATAEDMIGFVRDFKKFTSKAIQKNILAFEPSVLRLFAKPEGGYEFWQEGNMPKLIENEDFLEQKTNYIIYNPVRKQYVKNPADWVWSSANPESPVRIDILPV